jgi:hypothetical protein
LTFASHAFPCGHSVPQTACEACCCLASRNGERAAASKSAQGVTGPATRAAAHGESTWMCSRALQQSCAAQGLWVQSEREACILLNPGQRWAPGKLCVSERGLWVEPRCGGLPDQSPSRSRDDGCAARQGRRRQWQQAGASHGAARPRSGGRSRCNRRCSRRWDRRRRSLGSVSVPSAGGEARAPTLGAGRD